MDKVRPQLYGLKFDAPGTQVMLDKKNHHLHKPVLIGEIKKEGQFKVVHSSKGLVAPEPWSIYTSPCKSCDHVQFGGTYDISNCDKKVAVTK